MVLHNSNQARSAMKVFTSLHCRYKLLSKVDKNSVFKLRYCHNKPEISLDKEEKIATKSDDLKEIISNVDENIKTDSNADVKELLDMSFTGDEVKPEENDQMWATSPYPKGAVNKRSQALYSNRPKINPQDTSVLLFPGQGTQFVGMGKSLLRFPIARDLFDGANDLLGYNLLKLCLEGPKEQLNKTIYCQPAVFVCSLAALEKLKEERPAAIENCYATAGFSVGEITALTFAGAITFDQAIRLVKVRAEAMQLASEICPSGMMTVLYSPDSNLNHACIRAKEWCIQRGIENPECRVANYLFPQCKVIAGHTEALKFIESNSNQFKLKRCKRLPVSGAFHTELMRPAIESFKKALQKVDISDPAISVHSNVDGKMYRDAQHIKKQLPHQICKPVKWEQTMHILYERTEGEFFPRTFECGPGSSLKTVLKMVNAKASDNCINIEA